MKIGCIIGLGGRSITDGPGIWIVLGVIAGVIVGATCIVDRGGPWTVTVEVIIFSEEEFFSEEFEVCTVVTVSKSLC